EGDNENGEGSGLSGSGTRTSRLLVDWAWQSRQLRLWLTRTSSWTTGTPFSSGVGTDGSGASRRRTSSETMLGGDSATSASAAWSAAGGHGLYSAPSRTGR